MAAYVTTHASRRGCRGRIALAAVIVGDHAIARVQRLPLRFEHMVIEQQTVRKNHGLCAVAGLDIVEIDTVGRGGRHGRSPERRWP